MKWTFNLDNQRNNLLKEGFSYREIANLLSDSFGIKITYKNVKNRTEYFKRKNNKIDNDLMDINQDIQNILMKNDTFNPVENYMDELNNVYEFITNKDINNILVLSDLHCPYVNLNFLDEAIKNHSNSELCILNGDVLDCASFSKFDDEYNFSITKEINIAKKIFDKLSKTFKYVLYIKGNHEKRYEKFINSMPLKYNAKYILDCANPMKNLTNNYKNIIFVDNYFVEIFDIIFAHPSNFSNGILKTVSNVNLDMKAKKDILPNRDYKAVIIGHTHALGSAFAEDNIYIAETGCMCNLQPYKYTNSSKTMWQPGYMVIKIKNKKIDINNSKLIYLKYDFMK